MSHLFTTLEPDHAEAASQLMVLCFPQIAAADLLEPEHFRHIATLFPEGTIVVFDGDEMVGMGTGLFLDIDFDNLAPSEGALIGECYYENHDLNGAYYYGVGITVHPDYRGHGIGRKIYERRKALVERYNKKGIVAAGVLAQYGGMKDEMTPHAYTEKVVAGELYDSTLSMQLRNGFQVQCVIHGFFGDNETDNWGTLIVWENPAYRELC